MPHRTPTTEQFDFAGREWRHERMETPAFASFWQVPARVECSSPESGEFHRYAAGRSSSFIKANPMSTVQIAAAAALIGALMLMYVAISLDDDEDTETNE